MSQLYNQKSDSAFLNELQMKANNLVIFKNSLVNIIFVKYAHPLPESYNSTSVASLACSVCVYVQQIDRGNLS